MSHSTGCFFERCCIRLAVLLSFDRNSFQATCAAFFFVLEFTNPNQNSRRNVAFLPNKLFYFRQRAVAFFLSFFYAVVAAVMLEHTLRYRSLCATFVQSIDLTYKIIICNKSIKIDLSPGPMFCFFINKMFVLPLSETEYYRPHWM